MHVRMVCPWKESLQAMFTHQTVKCLPIKEITAPEATNCPVCFSELTRSRRMNPTQHTIISTKGSRWSDDFGFYKVYSVRGFKCFLIIV